MAQFPNEQDITKITFPEIITHNFCPMGNDWYSNHLTIILEPDKIVPDYVDVDKYIHGLNGEKLIIEDVVVSVYKYIFETYRPKYLKVVSNASDAVHSPVIVEKEMK